MRAYGFSHACFWPWALSVVLQDPLPNLFAKYGTVLSVECGLFPLKVDNHLSIFLSEVSRCECTVSKCPHEY